MPEPARSTGRRVPAPKAQARPARQARPDGEQTRQHILDTAGRVFAQQGYANTTGRQICEHAGTNMAAINYHFGSREGLYQAVLVEAHRQLVSLDTLAALAGAGAAGSPRERLHALLGQLLSLGAVGAGRGTRAAHAPWGLRVVLREAMSPSPLLPAMVRQAVQPKARLLRGLVGEVVGLPPSHPAVQRCLLLCVLPCIVLALAPRDLAGRVLPAVRARDALGADLRLFVDAGLDAVAAAHRPAAAAASARAKRASLGHNRARS